MKFQSTLLCNLLLALIFLSNANLKAQCDDPLYLDWLQYYLSSTCTDKVYAFTYNNEDYVYATSTPSCIAADAANTLYNCNTQEECAVFGFTLPEAQCNASLLQNIASFLTDENVIYPISTVSRNCSNPLFMEWLSPLLELNCTDGVYSFQHQGVDYLYRSTACEYVDDPNYLYNCATAEICYVQGRTFPELQCDLTEFPLDDYLIRENIIWSTPLLDLVKDFPWLTTRLNIKNCTDNVVSRYDVPGITYLAVSKNNANILYNGDGDVYCTDRDNLNCLDAYNLNEPNSEWSCNKREPVAVCEAIDTDDLPSWLNEYIDSLSCECGGEILQYCYNDVTYISYQANAPFCADYAGFIFSEDGTQICQNGGFTGGDCFTILPDFFEEATLVNDLWACEDCSQLAFETANFDCTSCCKDIVNYTITGTTSNYTVTNAINGEEVLNGGWVTAFNPANGNIDLLVTTTSGCSASVSFPFYPFCCEVPPVCEINNVFYDCNEGLQIEANSFDYDQYNDCSQSATFEDEMGNTYKAGDIITADGTYNLTTTGSSGFFSPPCSTYEITVNCGNNNDPCQLDAGQIITEPSFCLFGPGAFLEADYRNPIDGPDDNEYVFVQVNSDDSFNVLSGYYDFPKEGCYYGVHYRSSCDVPNFNVATFSEILDADANYAITDCFEFIINDTPLYSITTAPYCDGEGLFTLGVTVTRGSGNYYIGQDYTGQTIYGEEGENFITFASGFDYTLLPADVGTGCNSDIVLAVIDPGCGTFTETCELPADSGPCEAYIPRYYYDSAEGQCLEFIYGGCEGNANNFETYELCIESCGPPGPDCAPGQPINWPWIQSLINNRDFCYVNAIDQFIYNGETYFRTSPYAGSYSCPTDLPYVFYDCEGSEVCKIGFFPPGAPERCDDEFAVAANNNSTNIWTYSFDGCSDPFELEIVQNAINYPDCTGGIYAFNYQNEDYVYISTLCEFVDDSNTLYNCNTGETCYIGGENIPVEECYNSFNEIESLINDENLIWSSCENKIEATVRDYSGLASCGFVFELDNGTILEPIIVNLYNITFVEGLRVEFSYIPLNQPSTCQAGIVSEIFCINVIEEELGCGDPLEFEFVQNAINYPNCTEGVYAFNYQNEDYIFVQSLCQYIDDSSILYNCNSGETCYVGGDFNYSRECEDFYVEIAYLVNDENSIWSRPCNYEFTGEVKYIPVNGCYNYKIELENGIKLEPITVQTDFTFSEGQIVEFSYNTIQPGISFCESDSLVNIVCIREVDETRVLGDPFETEIVQNALNSSCTGSIYVFNYQNNDYIYISTVCQYADATNTLYNYTIDQTCNIGGLAFPDKECTDIYNQVQSLINDENLIWSQPCNYEHKGAVKNDAKNGCGYFIELDDGTNIEAVSMGQSFTFSEGQRVELSYNVLQTSSYCEADFYVSITCIREIDEGCVCPEYYQPVCGVDGVTYDNPCFAECEGIEIAYEGECDNPCPDPLCDSIGTPVCGVDGNTYNNPCEAECLGVEIAYNGECGVPNNEVFESFPWLLDIVDPVYCASGLTVDVYMKGIFSYIFVKYPAAPGILYFQDGAYYCEDVRDFSCVAAYSLTDLVATWACDIEPPTDIQAEFSNLICNSNGSFSIDVTATGAFSESYGIYGQIQDGGAPTFFNFAEGETYTFNGNVADGQNNIYTIFIYDLYLADVAATPFEINIEECNDDGGGETSPIFEQYTWLNDIISPGNCSNGSRVIEYDLGPYAFIFVETPMGNTLYYQDGTYYCADRSNFSCEEVYGLTTATNIWNCSDVPPSNNCVIADPLSLVWLQEIIENWGADECGLKEVKAFNYQGDDYIYTLSYPIYPQCPTDTGGSSIYDCDGNIICNFGYFWYNPEPCDEGLISQSNGDLIWEYTSNTDDGILIKYPWMYDLFDPINCLGITVQEYDNGAFAFITVEDETGLKLYFEDGSIFCTDRENFSCVEAYDLVDVTATWSCGFANKNEQAANKLVGKEEIIKIYPNPNNGVFTIDLTEIKNKIQKIEIYDIAGKQHYIPIDLNEATTTLKLNASNLNSGSYIVTVQTENKLHTETVIIH